MSIRRSIVMVAVFASLLCGFVARANAQTLNAASMTFAASVGGAVASQRIDLVNPIPALGLQTVTVSKLASWLQVTPMNDTIQYLGHPYLVSVNTSGLEAGQYTDTMLMTLRQPNGVVTTTSALVTLTLTGGTTPGGMAGETLSWLSNTEPDLRGYWVYHSTTKGVYTSERIFVPKVTTPTVSFSYTIPTEQDGMMHFFVVTAVDDAADRNLPPDNIDNESPKSNEVTKVGKTVPLYKTVVDSQQHTFSLLGPSSPYFVQGPVGIDSQGPWGGDVVVHEGLAKVWWTQKQTWWAWSYPQSQWVVTTAPVIYIPDVTPPAGIILSFFTDHRLVITASLSKCMVIDAPSSTVAVPVITTVCKGL